MPTVLRIWAYRFYLYSHEPNEPPHIHIDKNNLSAKFWLEPASLAKNILWWWLWYPPGRNKRGLEYRGIITRCTCTPQPISAMNDEKLFINEYIGSEKIKQSVVNFPIEIQIQSKQALSNGSIAPSKNHIFWVNWSYFYSRLV